MDCLFLPYCNYFYSLLINWKHLDNNKKIEIIDNIKSGIKFLKGDANEEDFHFDHFFETFVIRDNKVILNISELYIAYELARKCKICYSCNNILVDFYSLCAKELFDDDVIEKYNSDWLSSINNVSNNSKMKITPIDSSLLSHVNIYRDSIVKQYIKKINKNVKHNKESNYLLVLKGMSSSSPWMYNNTTNKSFSGGGFFVKWNNFGIAIDPGYRFVENLHRNKLSINDIDVVIVTHNHIDHNHDIRIIDDMNKCAWNNTKHSIRWYLDKSTYESSKFFLEDYSNINKKDNEECNKIEYNKETMNNYSFEINEECTLTIFPTQHIIKEKAKDGTINFSNDSFGTKFDFYNNGILALSLGYTSDTHYFPLLNEYLKGVDIIIANISGIYEDDIKKIKSKDKHLGYYGCYSLLKSLNKKFPLFLLSEFWSGNDDIRFDIAQYMKKEFEIGFRDCNVKIHPADIGMKISLTDLSIKCSVCGCYSKNTHTIKPKEDYANIQYICDSCIL